MLLNCARTNPFRPADWRWKRAIGAIEHTQPPPTRRRDQPEGYKWIRDAIRFKQLYDRCADNPHRKFDLANERPQLFWAYWLFNRDNHPSKEAVEAYLLARQTDHEIGFRFGIPPDVIEAYEALFFNVRERLNHTEYIVHCVIGPLVQRGIIPDKDFGILWKLYGYFCGPHFLAGLVSKFPNPSWCQTPDGLSAALQDDAIGTLKMKAAIAAKTIPVNHSTHLALLDIFTKFVEVERTTESQGRSQDALLDHIQACLTSLPFQVGVDTRAGAVDQSPTAVYDHGAVELQFTEVMQASARIPLANSEVLQQLSFPVTVTTQKDLAKEKLLGGTS